MHDGSKKMYRFVLCAYRRHNAQMPCFLMLHCNKLSYTHTHIHTHFYFLITLTHNINYNNAIFDLVLVSLVHFCTTMISEEEIR